MNHNVNKIISELKMHKEGMDKEYINALSANYRDYAIVSLTLNSFMLYEMGMDEEKYKTESIKKYINRLVKIIDTYIVKKQDIDENTIKIIDELRKDIIEKVDDMIKYTAKLYMYEYILNRLEHNFVEPIDNSSLVMDEDAFVNYIVDYIFSSKDNMIINERIRAVIGQLPVRMTKNKFFELVRESFTIYKGSMKEDFESYLDRIRTSATLYMPKYMDDEFEVLYSAVNYFESIDYKKVSKEQFEEATDRYREISKYIRIYTDFYSHFQDIVNKIYMYVLANKTATLESNDIDLELNKVLAHLVEGFTSDYEIPLEDDIATSLLVTEGVQERCHDVCMRLESVITDGIIDRYLDNDSTLADKLVNMKKCAYLMSNSLYMSLDKTPNTEIVDDAILLKYTEDIIRELKELFSKSPKVYNRAVMANVLSELPVFFENIDEVAEYVRNQVSACTNNSEKMACYAIITDMADDRYFEDETLE